MSELSIPQNGGNNPIKFMFGDDEIRIVKREGFEPLFVASDVCKALDISNSREALSRLDDDEKDDVILTDTIGRQVKMSAVTESGMYTLVMSSRKPTAKQFKRWVTHEVLPSIRATGGYVAPSTGNNALDVLRQMVETFAVQQQQLTEHDERISQLEESAGWQSDYFTVLGYFRKHNLPAPSMNEAQSIGQRATKLSHERGRGIGKANDLRFGTINSYHVSILDEIVKR